MPEHEVDEQLMGPEHATIGGLYGDGVFSKKQALRVEKHLNDLNPDEQAKMEKELWNVGRIVHDINNAVDDHNLGESMFMSLPDRLMLLRQSENQQYLPPAGDMQLLQRYMEMYPDEDETP